MLAGYTGSSVIHQVRESRTSVINGARYGTSLCGVGCSLDFEAMSRSSQKAAKNGRPCISCSGLAHAQSSGGGWGWVLLAILVVAVLALLVLGGVR